MRALRDERGNLEGATAFATFVGRSHRRTVARAAIAFQAVYDYVDAVSEQTESRWDGNTRQLHMALMIAVKPELPHLDYYALEIPGNDGGYLAGLVDECRDSLALLPSHTQVAESIGRATSRIIDYQHFNHRSDNAGSFASWAEGETPPEADLRWWETGAAAGSSLAVFALMAASAFRMHVASVSASLRQGITTVNSSGVDSSSGMRWEGENPRVRVGSSAAFR